MRKGPRSAPGTRETQRDMAVHDATSGSRDSGRCSQQLLGFEHLACLGPEAQADPRRLAFRDSEATSSEEQSDVDLLTSAKADDAQFKGYTAEARAANGSTVNLQIDVAAAVHNHVHRSEERAGRAGRCRAENALRCVVEMTATSDWATREHGSTGACPRRSF